MPATRARGPIGLLAAAALALAGCGGGTGTLTGKVTFQGKPVVFGTVTAQAADGTRRVGNIEPDGTYTVLAVPAGTMQPAVTCPEPPEPAAKRPPPRPGSSEPPPPPQAIDRSKW